MQGEKQLRPYTLKDWSGKMDIYTELMAIEKKANFRRMAYLFLLVGAAGILIFCHANYIWAISGFRYPHENGVYRWNPMESASKLKQQESDTEIYFGGMPFQCYDPEMCIDFGDFPGNCCLHNLGTSGTPLLPYRWLWLMGWIGVLLAPFFLVGIVMLFLEDSRKMRRSHGRQTLEMQSLRKQSGSPTTKRLKERVSSFTKSVSETFKARSKDKDSDEELKV